MADDQKIENQDEPKGKPSADDGAADAGGDAKDEGAIRALRAERQARKELERELKTIRDESAKAEQTRLEEQGKYKEIAEKKAAELEALTAKQAKLEFESTVHKMFSDANLAPLAPVALKLKGAETADDMLEVVKSLKDAQNALVEAAVLERLKTPTRPGSSPGANAPNQPQRFAYPSMESK